MLESYFSLDHYIIWVQSATQPIELERMTRQINKIRAVRKIREGDSLQALFVVRAMADERQS